MYQQKGTFSHDVKRCGPVQRSVERVEVVMKNLKRHTILMLSANPVWGSRLALDREARGILLELERSTYRAHFELVTWWAVEPLDLLAGLRRLKPLVVHFSGHGIQGAPGERGPDVSVSRDVTVDPVEGLCFARSDGGVEVVSPSALIDTFRAAGASVRLVVLNACYTESQAHALREHVDCVIGTRGAIQDEAAINFAIGLYGALGDGASVAQASAHGRAAISLNGQPDRDRPQLEVRDGLDPSEIILASPRPRRPTRRASATARQRTDTPANPGRSARAPRPTGRRHRAPRRRGRRRDRARR